MTPEEAQALREDFPAKMVGKLPRVSCKACSDARDRVCDKHAKRKCDVCGGYLTTAHIHLDYVGHAAVVDRLLKIDPCWTWRPFTHDELACVGAQAGELWIWLTVCDVTRPGVGDGPDAKQRISDAIRNAAMRFGVALSLWAKEDLHTGENEPDKPDTAQLEAVVLALVVELGSDMEAAARKLEEKRAALTPTQFESWLVAQQEKLAANVAAKGSGSGPSGDGASTPSAGTDETSGASPLPGEVSMPSEPEQSSFADMVPKSARGRSAA